jgi:hypothetical protein
MFLKSFKPYPVRKKYTSARGGMSNSKYFKRYFFKMFCMPRVRRRRPDPLKPKAEAEAVFS